MTRTSYAIDGSAVNLKRLQSQRAPFCRERGFFWAGVCPFATRDVGALETGNRLGELRITNAKIGAH